MSLQINYITVAKNPGDVREWIETAWSMRALTFANVIKTAERELNGGDESSRAFGTEVVSEASAIEKILASEPERFGTLFQALAMGDHEGAERARDDVLERETNGALRLQVFRIIVKDQMDSVTIDAKRREQRAIEQLVGLALLTLFVGITTSLYARRALSHRSPGAFMRIDDARTPP